MWYGPRLELDFASECDASWEDMKGDERVRFCGECKLNVYNLSEMTAEEALALFKKTEGRVCVRAFERPDGTILTKNCPVGEKKYGYRAVLGEPTPPSGWGRSD
jgi:hypothetical protein